MYVLLVYCNAWKTFFSPYTPFCNLSTLLEEKKTQQNKPNRQTEKKQNAFLQVF